MIIIIMKKITIIFIVVASSNDISLLHTSSAIDTKILKYYSHR